MSAQMRHDFHAHSQMITVFATNYSLFCRLRLRFPPFTLEQPNFQLHFLPARVVAARKTTKTIGGHNAMAWHDHWKRIAPHGLTGRANRKRRSRRSCKPSICASFASRNAAAGPPATCKERTGFGSGNSRKTHPLARNILCDQLRRAPRHDRIHARTINHNVTSRRGHFQFHNSFVHA